MAFKAKRMFQRSVQRDAVKILSPVGIEYATYEDLSAGGLKLLLDHEVSASAVLTLEFSIRENNLQVMKIKVLGKVVRCVSSKDGFEVGVQFMNLQTPTRMAIEKLFDETEGPF